MHKNCVALNLDQKLGGLKTERKSQISLSLGSNKNHQVIYKVIKLHAKEGREKRLR